MMPHHLRYSRKTSAWQGRSKRGYFFVHLALTLMPCVVSFLPHTPVVEMLSVAVGLGVGTGTSLYLLRRSPFRTWAIVLFSLYTLLVVGWIVLPLIARCCFVKGQ